MKLIIAKTILGIFCVAAIGFTLWFVQCICFLLGYGMFQNVHAAMWFSFGFPTFIGAVVWAASVMADHEQQNAQ